MNTDSVQVEVDVRVDPASAFRIFTEEVDLWWVRGPANFYDGSRARGKPTAHGTRVVVVQRGGGMSAWKNILGWFRRRADHGYQASEMPRITPVLFYANVPAAADWLGAAFGFWCRGKMGSDFAELELEGGVVLLRGADGQSASARSLTYAYVDDLEQHFEQAKEAGATIVTGFTARATPPTSLKTSNSTAGPSRRPALRCASAPDSAPVAVRA